MIDRRKAVLVTLGLAVVIGPRPADAQRAYWSTGRVPVRVQRGSLTGRDAYAVEDLVFTDHIQPRSIALDTRAGKIYWSDRWHHGILRADLDGTNVEAVIVPEDQPSILGITLDPSAGKIYWSRNTPPRKIQRANLDGSNVEDVLMGVASFGIAVDALGGKIYWTGYGIVRANLDGSNVEEIVTGLERPVGIALDLLEGKVYWSDPGTRKLQRANLNGTDIEDLVLFEPGPLPTEIALDLVAGKMYWMERSADRIMRADLAGSNVEEVLVIAVDVTYPWGIAVDESAGKLYWSDDYRVMRADLDGSNRKGVVVKIETSPRGMALDVDHGKLYWADHDSRKVRRSNLDGSDVEDLVSTELWPVGIALDVSGGLMYWTEYDVHTFNGTIRRADLDGSNIEEPLVQDVFPSGPVALDLVHGKMYWVWSFWWIYRGDLDGSNIEYVLYAGGETLDIALDPLGGKIYWGAADYEYWDYAIRRANLDGSEIEEIVPYDWAEVITLDVEAGKMYYADSRWIYRADLDGTNRGPVLYAASPPMGIALDLRVPGDCDEDHLLGLSDHTSFVQCMTGPGGDFAPGCSCADDNGDRDIDLADFATVQATFAGP